MNSALLCRTYAAHQIVHFQILYSVLQAPSHQRLLSLSSLDWNSLVLALRSIPQSQFSTNPQEVCSSSVCFRSRVQDVAGPIARDSEEECASSKGLAPRDWKPRHLATVHPALLGRWMLLGQSLLHHTPSHFYANAVQELSDLLAVKDHSEASLSEILYSSGLRFMSGVASQYDFSSLLLAFLPAWAHPRSRHFRHHGIR